VAFRSEAIDPGRHLLDALDSGEPEIDEWLRLHAEGAEARRVARSFVWVDPAADRDRVLGYYSLAGHLLVRDALPRGIGRESPAEIPAVLLARLALDRSLQGDGMGGALLVDALSRVVTASRTVAARLVVVDALSEAAAGFYAHHGFRRIPGTLRLVQKVSDIAAAIEPPAGPAPGRMGHT
jgi:GNAT superfamily N-acetyltransferase